MTRRAPLRPCRHCGVEFRPCELDTGRRHHYCCQDCRDEGHRRIMRALMRRFYAAHPGYASQSTRKSFLKKSPDERRAIQARHREKHREKIRAYARKWHARRKAERAAAREARAITDFTPRPPEHGVAAEDTRSRRHHAPACHDQGDGLVRA